MADNDDPPDEGRDGDDESGHIPTALEQVKTVLQIVNLVARLLGL